MIVSALASIELTEQVHTQCKQLIPDMSLIEFRYWRKGYNSPGRMRRPGLATHIKITFDITEEEQGILKLCMPELKWL